MKFPVIEIVDRYAIAVVKHEKTNGANFLELAFYLDQINEINLDTNNQLLLQLIEHHKLVWSMEDQFKKNRVDNLPLEEIGRFALEVRDLGHRRTELKNALAELLDDPIRDFKQDHISE
jgi:hypothetical protein